MISMKVYAYLGGSWTDITSDTLANAGISASVGIPGNKETDRIAADGTLSFTLKNNDAKYTPGSGTAHADWKKGTPVKVVFTKFEDKTKFIGRVDKIRLNYNYNNSTASITAKDWIYYASQLPLDIPALQEDQRSDQIVTTILGFAPIQPEATSLQTGYTTYPYAFHDNTVKTTAYSEISKAVSSDWGYGYVKLDGTLTLETYNGRTTTQKELTVTGELDGSLLLEDETELLLEDGTPLLLEDYSIYYQDAEISAINDINMSYAENIINRFSVQVQPYKLGDYDELVYTNEINQTIPAGQTISFRIPFTDQSSKQPLAAIQPTVKQTTLIHFDTPPEGVTGIQEDIDATLPFNRTSFSFASGASLSTSVKKFGTASLVLNGSSDYVYSSTQEKFNLRNGDFTADWWEYRLASTAGKAVISRSTSAAFSPYVFGYSDGTYLRCYITSDGASWDIANGKSFGTLATSTWTHYAISRSGNTYRTFKNGVLQDTWTSSATIYPSTDNFSIGLYNGGYFNGYIDEVRVVKGYAEYTDAFTPAVTSHKMSGINWRVHEAPERQGTELTSSMTATASPGGTGMDFEITSASGTDGYLVLDVYARPLQSLSPLSHIAEDATSINEYGYFSQNVEMRLRPGVYFAKIIADEVIAAEKDPRTVLHKISFVANKNDVNEALFMQCDLGDLININESLSGYDARNHINHISWNAIAGDGGVIVYVDFTVKEQ